MEPIKNESTNNQNKSGLNYSEEAKEARRKYLREWRKKNPDKQKRYVQNYWQKKANILHIKPAFNTNSDVNVNTQQYIVLLYNQGNGVAEIAELLNMNIQSIRDVLIALIKE
jgi:hypothetical protein